MWQAFSSVFTPKRSRGDSTREWQWLSPFWFCIFYIIYIMNFTPLAADLFSLTLSDTSVFAQAKETVWRRFPSVINFEYLTLPFPVVCNDIQWHSNLAEVTMQFVYGQQPSSMTHTWAVNNKLYVTTALVG
jgi:hypothetical protein